MSATGLTAGERTIAITRAAMRFCLLHAWSPLTEVSLPNGRRADLLALTTHGELIVIEVKSCLRDYDSDTKWPEYRAFADRLFFAVDLDFPRDLLPADVGLLVADGLEATQVRDAPTHPLAPARRRALVHRFAHLAAMRLAVLSDPAGAAELRAALRLD